MFPLALSRSVTEEAQGGGKKGKGGGGGGGNKASLRFAHRKVENSSPYSSPQTTATIWGKQSSGTQETNSSYIKHNITRMCLHFRL